MRTLFRFFSLPFTEKKLLVQSVVLILFFRVGLWILPFAMLNRLLRGTTAAIDGEPNWTNVKRVVRSVRLCSRFVPYATCLTQALATRVLLSLGGQHSDLKFGVEKDNARNFKAHAWIEVDGRIVIGELPRHQRFAVLNSN